MAARPRVLIISGFVVASGACTASGDADDVAVTTSEPEETDAADSDVVPDVTVYPPGSFEACAALYQGFDTCCVFDEQSGAWSFEKEPCRGAYQCVADEDCPPGFVETTDYRECVCRPQVRTRDFDCDRGAPARDGSCPEGTHACPTTWPPDGPGTCTHCPCPLAVSQLPLRGTYLCPEDEQRTGCPCHLGGGPCCLRIGEGLSCSAAGVYEHFWDCPCAPDSFGCSGPRASLCVGIRPQ